MVDGLGSKIGYVFAASFTMALGTALGTLAAGYFVKRKDALKSQKKEDDKIVGTEKVRGFEVVTILTSHLSSLLN